MASSSSLGLHLRLADIDENLKSHPAALSWPVYGPNISSTQMKNAFVNDSPCFTYKEVFECGEVFQAVSTGLGIFLPLHSVRGPQPAFTVSKNRVSKTIEIEICSLSMTQSLAIAIPSPFDWPSLLVNYSKLKHHLEYLETISPFHPTTVELRLLVQDCLLDRALYSGIGTELYRSQGLLTVAQLHDMHQRSVDAGLDDLDACFSLGLLPDILDDEYLEALISRFTELALTGDLAALHNLCEPVVRSGEIEWQADPDLLLQLLDSGRLDVYRYVLDLASRTKEKPAGHSGGTWLSDITHDPLLVAIRLGHLEQVESFLQQGAIFFGVYHGDDVAGSTVLAPLSAAALWCQPDILRLILLQDVSPVGSQEAIAIALSNNNTEIMQILLSSGVISPPLPYRRDDTTESFAELTITDQHPLRQMTREFSSHDDIEPHQSAGQHSVNHAQQSAPANEAPRRPTTQAPKEPIRRKYSRRQRYLTGRDIVSCMQKLCAQIRLVCDCSAHGELHSFGNDYIHPHGVWDRGVSVFRDLVQDNPPSALQEVIDSLLIANAICRTLFNEDDFAFVQFLDDLYRWRSVLPSASQVIFDELAFGMWAFTPSSGTTSDLDPENLPRFQELAHSLISLEERREKFPWRSSASGNRLSVIQKAFETGEKQQDAVQPRAIPGRSMAGKTSNGASSTQQDDFLWSEFIHVDQFEDMTKGHFDAAPFNSQWDAELTSTMALLLSVAFAMVLVLIIDLHSGSASRPIQLLAFTLPRYARTCNLLSEYLTLHNTLIRPERGPPSVTVPSPMPQPTIHETESYITPSTSSSSLSTLGLPRNVSSSSISSIGSMTALSPSRPPSRDHQQQRLGSRLPCLTPQCAKTFSSVSNRNKHLREGCPFNREKRQRFQCRNGSCTKVLTTKWYRDTHERERCRFRPDN